MPKIAVYAKLTAKPGRGDDLVALFKEEFEAVNDEPGTVVYAAHRPVDNPDVLWFYEVYADNDALGAHSGSPTMRATFPGLRDVLAGPAEIVVSEPVSAKGLDLL